VASANSQAVASNAYAAGVVTGSASTAAATSAAYGAGVATGAAMASAPPANYSMGVNYAALPAGSMSINKSGATYYLNGNTWFQPSYGANGVYYTVVPAP